MNARLEASFTVPDDLPPLPGAQVYMPVFIDSAELRAMHKRVGNLTFYCIAGITGPQQEMYYQIDDNSPYSEAMKRIQQASDWTEDSANLHENAVQALYTGEFDKEFAGFLPKYR